MYTGKSPVSLLVLEVLLSALLQESAHAGVLAKSAVLRFRLPAKASRRSLARPFPTGPASLGSGGAPIFL